MKTPTKLDKALCYISDKIHTIMIHGARRYGAGINGIWNHWNIYEGLLPRYSNLARSYKGRIKDFEHDRTAGTQHHLDIF